MTSHDGSIGTTLDPLFSGFIIPLTALDTQFLVFHARNTFSMVMSLAFLLLSGNAHG
jgi:hypothetical protein